MPCPLPWTIPEILVRFHLFIEINLQEQGKYKAILIQFGNYDEMKPIVINPVTAAAVADPTKI